MQREWLVAVSSSSSSSRGRQRGVDGREATLTAAGPSVLFFYPFVIAANYKYFWNPRSGFL